MVLVKKPSRCILWGMGADYEVLLNQILFEIHKGNITVEAIVCREADIYCNSRDGFPVISAKELKTDSFDYLIVTSNAYYREIRQEAIGLGIEEKRIINGKVFRMTYFDFGRYQKLLENPITILSDDCWGGGIYKSLGLPFSSPIINIAWDKNEYAEFIKDPLFYLGGELTSVQDGNLKKGIRQVCRLGNEERYVELNFVHSLNFEEAKKEWTRRVKRINSNNLFVKMGFISNHENKDYFIEVFNQVPYNKVLFYYGEEQIPRKLQTERFIWKEGRKGFVLDFNYSEFMRNNYYYGMDVLKLLTGEEEFSREK